MTSNVKTFLLLTVMSGILLAFGFFLGGRTGVMIAFAFAMIMNVGSYWFSDKIVLKMYNAREVSELEAPMLHRMVQDLAERAGLPMPRVCVMPEPTPNAFATGRDPEHGVVAVTEGILRLLSPDELRGVLAHEMGHIKNRDILIQTVAAVMGSAIMMLGTMVKWSALFGGGRSSDGSGNNNIIGALLLAILAPIAATLVQMAISRSREYLADETGATLCGKPEALASALNKLTTANTQSPMQAAEPATENMFIVTPFSAQGVSKLFSTHPPIEERVKRLRAMKTHK